MYAQPEPEEDGNPGGGDPTPDAAPINGKLISLALAGIVFAIYTFKRIRRERKEA